MSAIPITAPTSEDNRMTSGSTGQPKAAVRSHGFLLEQHRVLERAIHLSPGAIDLTTLPVFVLVSNEGRVLFNGDPSDDGLWDALRKLDPLIMRPEMTGPLE